MWAFGSLDKNAFKDYDTPEAIVQEDLLRQRGRKPRDAERNLTMNDSFDLPALLLYCHSLFWNRRHRRLLPHHGAAVVAWQQEVKRDLDSNSE
jgi:hypothetical protein